MTSSRRFVGPLLVSILLLAALTVWIGRDVYECCGDRLVYALDDAYIHMAMAKNLVLHRELGVTPYGFSASSSSIAWPLLLAAAYRVTGVNEWWPLALNLVCAVTLLASYEMWLSRRSVPAWIRVTILVGVLLFVPVVPMVFCGMEHLLHACTSVLFMAALYAVMSEARPEPRKSVWLLVAAAGVCLARFEGMFMVAAVCVVLFAERRRRLAVGAAIAGLSPILLFGLYSVSRGWYLLPNSVLLKASLPDSWSLGALVETFGSEFSQQLLDAPFLLALMLVAAVLLVALGKSVPAASPRRAALPAVLAVYLLTTLLHLLFARIGWFARYEAYLVALGLFVIGLAGTEWSALRACGRYARVGLAACVLLVGVPLAWRGLWGLQHTAQAAGNIYSQQYQMALFLKTAYPTGRVVMNDIGAASFLTDIRLLDLSGLANLATARARRAGCFDGEALRRLAAENNAQIAVAYNAPYIPKEWTEVSRWQIFDNVVCWSDTVSFYAVDPAMRDDLVARLREFVHRLPPGVGYQMAGETPYVPPAVSREREPRAERTSRY